MRLASSLAGAIAAMIWGYWLFEGITNIILWACADLAGFPAMPELLFWVVIPTAMFTLALMSIALTNYVRRPGRGITWMPFVILALLLPQYGLVSGVSITASAVENCRR